jgi:2-C-methyl-D-erythritol 4-phosphate cytidylyltransferase
MKGKLFAIIVAGGTGSRMQSDQPKQFLKLKGIPILMHTINAFSTTDLLIEISVVLPSDHFSHWKSLCEEFKFSTPHRLIEGGKTRGQSVLNGLKLLPDEGIVAIHDGVRPFVTPRIITDSFDKARKFGSAIASVDLKDSIRLLKEKGSQAVDRSYYKIVQTPQVFKVNIIKEAYKKIGDTSLSDDASVAEQAGYDITLVEGSYDNIKITTPEDLIVADKIAERLKL